MEKQFKPKHAEYYALVTVDWETVRDHFEDEKEMFVEEFGNINLNEWDFEQIAEDLSYNYSPEYDYATAIEEQIRQYLEDPANVTDSKD